MMTFAPSSTSGVTTEAHAMDSRRIGQWPLVEGQTAERPVGGRLVTRIGTCVPDRSGLIPVLPGDELSDQATDRCGELFARGAGLAQPGLNIELSHALDVEVAHRIKQDDYDQATSRWICAYPLNERESVNVGEAVDHEPVRRGPLYSRQG